MLQFLHSVEQLNLLDTADDAVAFVRAPAYAEHLPKFAAVRFDARAWADELRKLTTEARSTFTARDVGDDVFEDESAQVREVAMQFDAWVRKLHAAARAISVSDHPKASSVSRMFKVHNFEGETLRNIFGLGPSLLQSARRMGDLSMVGLTPEFFAEGEALLGLGRPEQDEVQTAKAERMSATVRLHLLLDAIVESMERFARYREYAMAMSGLEIPEIGLAQVRAALAGGAKAADVAPPAPPSVASPTFPAAAPSLS